MKYLIISLLLAGTAIAQTAGDYIFTQKTSGLDKRVYLTPEAGKFLTFDNDGSLLLDDVPEPTAGTGITVSGGVIALSSATQASLAKADSALQSSAIGVSVQGYNAALDTLSGVAGNNKIFGTNGTGVKGWYDAPSGAEWGSITGTLTDQTDLVSALAGKQDSLTAGTGVTINSGTISIGQSVGVDDSVEFDELNVGGGLLVANDVNVSTGVLFIASDGATLNGGVQIVGGASIYDGATISSGDLTFSSSLKYNGGAVNALNITTSANGTIIDYNTTAATPGGTLLTAKSNGAQFGVINFGLFGGSYYLAINSFQQYNIGTNADTNKIYFVPSAVTLKNAKVVTGRYGSTASSGKMVAVEFFAGSTGTISAGHGVRNEYTLSPSAAGTGVVAGADVVEWTSTASGGTSKRVISIRVNGVETNVLELTADGPRFLNLKTSSTGLASGTIWLDGDTLKVAP